MLICVYVPGLILQMEAVRHAQQMSLAIVDPARAVIVAASDDVLASGVRFGMSRFRARQIAPWAEVINANEAAYNACHEALAEVLKPFGPRLETVALGEFLLDLPGIACDSMEGETLAQTLIQSLRDVCALDVRAGLAANRFTAQQAARRVTDDGLCVVAEGKEGRFLGPLPVSTLPELSTDTLDRLALLGIQTLAQVAALSQAAVVRQFGKPFLLYHAMARGRDPRSVRSDVPPLRLHYIVRFDEPTNHRAVLEHGAMELCEYLAADLVHKGYQAESARLELMSVEGVKVDAVHYFKPPTSDPSRLAWLVEHLLDDLFTGMQICQVTLIAYPLRLWHLGVEQLSLFDADHQIKRARLQKTISLLERRFGQACLRLAARLPAPVPKPVTVIADSDGAPIKVCFNKSWRKIDMILEHWQIETGWWDQPVCRDYFQVLTNSGVLLNLFQEVTTREWFLDRRHYVL